MAGQEEWAGQADWGPKYPSWWEVCSECDGLYNWFNIEVMSDVHMFGWLHKGDETDGVEGPDCLKDRGVRFADTRWISSANEGSEEG